MFTIATVLKSGGVYHEGYVLNLHRQLMSVQKQLCNFVCLTDMVLKSKQIATLPLQDNLPGWWSKIEVFQLVGTVIYLDLDTAVFCDLSPLAQVVAQSDSFFMLKAFRKTETFASGIMSWSKDFTYLHDEFDMSQYEAKDWDQHYIKQKLHEHNATIKPVNETLPKIYSYKHHCRKQLPADAQIVCFHGDPRPEIVGAPYYP